MRRFAAFMSMLAAAGVQADCLDTWLTYGSPNLTLSVDYSEGCYQGELTINSRFAGKERRATSVPFRDECRPGRLGKNGEPVEFSCRKDGRSPLAGATYRYKSVRPGYRCRDGSVPLPDRSFICVSGCGAGVPQTLDVEYSEGACG